MIAKSILFLTFGLFLFGCKSGRNGQGSLTDKQYLGKLMFFDTALSEPAGQSCATCHDPKSGFADPNRNFPVSQGVNKQLFGNRNSPTVSYAMFSPALHIDADEGIYIGGQFWDGRANSLEEQAQIPFFNPLEMANVDTGKFMNKIKNAEYAGLFMRIYGKEALSDPKKALGFVGDAIAEFQRSKEVNPFTSKFDYYLEGKVKLTPQESIGLALFNDASKAKCAECHPSEMKENMKPLFTDFSYDNLGTPRNAENPFYKLDKTYNADGGNFVDLGLGGFLKNELEHGKHKVPTLRNVAITSPYMHNGVFNTLEEVVEFYSTRDIDGKWGKPEVGKNINQEELGDLKLSKDEINNIVAFLKTLTDGYIITGKDGK